MYKNSFFRYGLVGILSVILDYLLLYILFSLMNLSLNISISLAFFGSAIFNFLMHRIYTFKKRDSKIFLQVSKYILLISMSYAITIFLVNIFVNYGLNIFFSKFIITCIVYIYGYILGKFFIFIN